MSSQGIIGPFFFEDNDGNCQSVTSERYIPILNKFKMCLRRRGQDIANHWLARNFGDRVISLKTNFVWAPYSPDLNPLDFFLWGHLKDVVYRDVPLSLQELKDSITQHIHRINNDKDLCNRVILNFQKKNSSLFAKRWWPSRAYSMKLKMKLNVSYGFICFKICYS